MPMGHHHHHHGHAKGHTCGADLSGASEKRLWWAVAANVALTLGQVAGGIISGSLSLIADALHNFSDAASLFIALIAIRIGRKPADQLKTFGYKRAETVAALINLTTLLLLGLYLMYEAVMRFITPEPIMGWIVVIVAGGALCVDLFTAAMTYKHSKNSLNMRAAFLHNLTDAMASVGVIVAGTLILLYGWVWTDALMTLLIAGYVLWHGLQTMPKVIHILMEGSPEGIVISDIITAMEAISGVSNVHHVHIWQLDEHRNALEAHVVLSDQAAMDDVKIKLKEMLKKEFGIKHSTLEFENTHCQA